MYIYIRTHTYLSLHIPAKMQVNEATYLCTHIYTHMGLSGPSGEEFVRICLTPLLFLLRTAPAPPRDAAWHLRVPPPFSMELVVGVFLGPESRTLGLRPSLASVPRSRVKVQVLSEVCPTVDD